MTFAQRIRALVTRHSRITTAADQVVHRFPFLGDALGRAISGNPRRRYASWVGQYDSPKEAELNLLRELANMNNLPELSVVLLGDAIQPCLSRQLFNRFDVVHATACGHAIRSANREHVVLVDGTIQLRPHALLLLARALSRHPEAVAVYADEDTLSADGRRDDHYFKPDWNEALLRAQNYLGGVVCIRQSQAVGSAVDDVRDVWELLLRLTDGVPAGAVQHVPYVLSHRLRRVSDRDETRHRTRLNHIGGVAGIEAVGRASFRVSYGLPGKRPIVSVIVPSMCDPRVLQPCVEGLLNRTDYENREVVIVANGPAVRTDEGRAYIDGLNKQPKTRVLRYEGQPYNFSKLNNWASTLATGDLLCFLNDDTEVLRPDWLAALVAHTLQRGVGATGALLRYPSGRIQHAGVVLGSGGVAAHAYRGARSDAVGYHDRAVVTQDVSAVTAACMLVRRRAFDDIGGFDTDLAIRYNDVDFCLRLRSRGWRVLWTPDAVLRHNESASLGRVSLPAKREEQLVASRWKDSLRADPHHNPNLSLDALALWEPAFPPRLFYPWDRATTAYSPVS